MFIYKPAAGVFPFVPQTLPGSLSSFFGARQKEDFE
jgi:hypothetical protein